MKDMGKSSSRKLRYVIYYTLYRMDAQKRSTQIGFLQKCQKSKFKRKNAYMSSPLTHIALRRAPCNKVNGAYYEPDTPVMTQRGALKFIALQILLADSIIDELEKAARL